MTDNEIIKALKDEIRRANYIESYYIDCVDIGVFQNVIDLINLQKAEIERLKKELMQCKLEKEMIYHVGTEIKTVAIKEFVYSLKDRVVKKYDCTDIRIFDEVDNLVKEMTEVNENDRIDKISV